MEEGRSRRNRDESPTLPLLHGAAATFLKYLLAFGVSLAVGLAPLLGKVDVPGFTALLSIYPKGIAEGLVPFAALLMSLMAIGVQFFAPDNFDRSRLKKLFARYWFVLLILVVGAYLAYWKYVVRIYFAGGEGSQAFLVCAHQKPDSPCLNQTLDACIAEKIPLNPAKILGALCTPDDAKNAELILSVAYLGLMGCFGFVIGLLVVAEINQRRKRRRRRTSPSP